MGFEVLIFVETNNLKKTPTNQSTKQTVLQPHKQAKKTPNNPALENVGTYISSRAGEGLLKFFAVSTDCCSSQAEQNITHLLTRPYLRPGKNVEKFTKL